MTTTGRCIPGADFRRLIIIAAMTVLFIVTGAGMARANAKYASIVMDADTGEILSQSHADKALHPASLTKVMTLLMAFEAIERGKISLNDRIIISRHAAGMAPSKLGLKPGESIRVKDAIGALVTKSANDVAAALAEHLGGTESAFARQMTRRAHEIGMSRTNFANASGLHDPRQISTARDMATMARYVIRNHPGYYRHFSMSNFTYQGRTYRNHNRLMETYKGMDGMKTGYIAASGFNLVASAVRDNRRLIGVVFGGRTTQSRNNHMASLLDRGFEQIGGSHGDLRIASTQKTEAPKKNVSIPVPERKPVFALASSSYDRLKPGDAVSVTAPKAHVAATANPPPMLLGSFEALSGEGDADPGISRRIETGLMAIAAHKTKPARTPEYKLASYSPQNAMPPAADNPWSVQIGAFSSRAATDRILHDAMQRLPRSYAQARPIIAPLKTANGWVFRARLTGLSRSEALAACNYLRDCLPVAPQN